MVISYSSCDLGTLVMLQQDAAQIRRRRDGGQKKQVMYSRVHAPTLDDNVTTVADRLLGPLVGPFAFSYVEWYSR
jgi:hypothetical protein